MSKCGDCKYWGRTSTEIQDGVWRECGRIHFDETNSCRNDLDDESEFDQTIRHELAVTRDGSGYFAAIKCREDFGCVLWEPN